MEGYQNGYHAFLKNPYSTTPFLDDNKSEIFKLGFVAGRDKAISDMGEVKLGYVYERN